jgi:hypothetical protein
MNPPSWVTNEDYWRKQCQRLVAHAQELIEGRVGVIETARAMIQYRSWFRVGNDPDFMTFVGIDSETDHLPIGSVRQHWDNAALEKKDVEIKRAETFYRDQAMQAAQNLIQKYKAIP